MGCHHTTTARLAKRCAAQVPIMHVWDRVASLWAAPAVRLLSGTRQLPPMTPSTSALDRRVLVVDDDELVAGLIAKKARALGYTTDLALDAGRAIALAAVHDYSVVLTDLLMPGMGGIELLRNLTARSDSATFIVMTGDS